MEAPKKKEALKWLFSQLSDEALRRGDFSIVHEFLPVFDEFERQELLRFLFWESLRSRVWWLAEECLTCGISVSPSEAYADGPLHTAMRLLDDCADVIAWLLAHGADIERRDLADGNTTPLIHAARAGLNGVVKLLLQKGADPNASTIVDDDETPLMIASETGNHEAVSLLLSGGADIMRKDRWGQDAGERARRKGLKEEKVRKGKKK